MIKWTTPSHFAGVNCLIFRKRGIRMKKTFVCVLALLLCACQPTPEQDPVKQKDTVALIDTVLADQQEQQSAGAALPKVREQMPERFVCDFTTAGGTHVVSDEPIRILTGGTFPVLRVERRKVTDAERLTLAQKLLGADKLYLYHDVLSRKEIESMIQSLMNGMTEEEKQAFLREDGDEESWEDLVAWRQQQLEHWKQLYRDLPSDDSPVPNQPWNGETPDPDRDKAVSWTIVIESEGKTNLSWLPYVTAYAEETDRVLRYQALQRGHYDITECEGVTRIEPEDYGKVHEGASISAQTAAESVLPYFDGILNLHIDDIYWSNDADLDGEQAGEIHNWAYLIHLTPDYDGAATVFCEETVINEETFTRPWEYERVTAAVSGDGTLLSLSWEGPLAVTDTVAKSTTLLPYETVQATFRQHMERMQYGDGAAVTVTSVKLGLFRIREKNSMETGLLIPAWVIESVWDFEGMHKSLEPVVINAIDGSVIDAGKGY